MTEQTSAIDAHNAVDEGAWAAASVRADVDAAEVDVVFRRQPRPVAARHRVAYRTALLVLVLSRFNQEAAKLTNLHTLMWATRTARTRRMFAAWWAGRRFFFTTTDRIDPDLQVTLNLALVDGLIVPGTNRARVQLADKGRDLARRIDALDDLLVVEKAFLAGLERLSDGAMERRLEAVSG
jgi:hypothetical protein